MIWKTTNCRGEPVTWYSEDEILKEREKMSATLKLINDLNELYKNLFKNQDKSTKQKVDFYLNLLEEQAEANRKRMQELGQLTEAGANV